MAAQITDTVEKSMQAAVCAYTEPCFFFDDLMADLDQSLFKLAVLCFDTKENDDLYAEMQSKIVGKVPVLGETVTAVTKILDASASTVKVAARIAEVGSSLLKIGKTGLGNL